MVLVNHVIEMKHQLNHQIHYCVYAGVWVRVGVRKRKERDVHADKISQ